MIRKFILSTTLVLAGAAGVSAQEYVLDEIYGRGVHRFFAHDYPSAIENLTMAIENGSQDPRAFYFRGLATAAMGNTPDAESDWQQGAMIEAKGAYGDLIGRSLARIQGPVRLHLEKVRQRARLELLAQRRANDQLKYEGGVRPQVPAPPVGPVTPAPVVPTEPSDENAVPPTPSDNPFADDPILGTGEPSVDSSDALSGALDAARPAAVEPTPSTPATPAQPETPVFGDEPGSGFDFGDPPAGDTPDNPFDF